MLWAHRTQLRMEIGIKMYKGLEGKAHGKEKMQSTNYINCDQLEKTLPTPFSLSKRGFGELVNHVWCSAEPYGSVKAEKPDRQQT